MRVTGWSAWSEIPGHTAEVLYPSVARAVVGEEFSGHDEGLAVYHLGCRMGKILLRHCPEPKKHPGELRSPCCSGATGGEGRFEGSIPSLDESISLWMICRCEVESDPKELR